MYVCHGLGGAGNMGCSEEEDEKEEEHTTHARTNAYTQPHTYARTHDTGRNPYTLVPVHSHRHTAKQFWVDLCACNATKVTKLK